MTTPKSESLSGEHVVAVLATPAAAQEEAAKLEQAGFGPAGVFSGEDLTEVADPSGKQSGLLTKILRHAQDALSEEQTILTQYEEEARHGKGVLAVSVSTRKEAESVRDALANTGAYNIRYFSRLSVTDMSPESNPSALGDAPSET